MVVDLVGMDAVQKWTKKNGYIKEYFCHRAFARELCNGKVNFQFPETKSVKLAKIWVESGKSQLNIAVNIKERFDKMFFVYNGVRKYCP